MAIPKELAFVIAVTGIFGGFSFMAVKQEDVYKTAFGKTEASAGEKFAFTFFALAAERGINALVALLGARGGPVERVRWSLLGNGRDAHETLVGGTQRMAWSAACAGGVGMASCIDLGDPDPKNAMGLCHSRYKMQCGARLALELRRLLPDAAPPSVTMGPVVTSARADNSTGTWSSTITLQTRNGDGMYWNGSKQCAVSAAGTLGLILRSAWD